MVLMSPEQLKKPLNAQPVTGLSRSPTDHASRSRGSSVKTLRQQIWHQRSLETELTPQDVIKKKIRAQAHPRRISGSSAVRPSVTAAVVSVRSAWAFCSAREAPAKATSTL
ncbi:hypothetical protein Vafri_17213, partial [Volvox africanus]